MYRAQTNLESCRQPGWESHPCHLLPLQWLLLSLHTCLFYSPCISCMVHCPFQPVVKRHFWRGPVFKFRCTGPAAFLRSLSWPVAGRLHAAFHRLSCTRHVVSQVATQTHNFILPYSWLSPCFSGRTVQEMCVVSDTDISDVLCKHKYI